MGDQGKMTVYIHVADDGGLLLIDGDTGRSSWVTLAELGRTLDLFEAESGAVLMSRESGSRPAEEAIRSIVSHRVNVTEATQRHPDAYRQGGVTTLMASAYNGALHIVDDLIAREADIDAGDDDGATALMYAANGQHSDVVSHLLAAGAEPNCSDENGSTPLMFAAQHGDDQIIRMLIRNGADPGTRRTDGRTAEDFAREHGHNRTAAAIVLMAEQP